MSTDTPRNPPHLVCPVCGHESREPQAGDLGQVRGNTERFREQEFGLWKCPQCQSIVALDPIDFHDVYSDYPLNKRKLDVFARSTLANLLHRLRASGMQLSDSILDYGCGNNIFVDYLHQRGFAHAVGYDPYVPEHSRVPQDRAPFDVIVNNDTIEHCDDPRGMIRECLALLEPGGLLYLGTADSGPVDMSDLEPHVMRLHQPFHRIVLTEQTLHDLVHEFDVDVIASWTRSYHDTRRPMANYRFLDELNKAVGHNLDRALEPSESTRAFLRTPRLWFFAFFGYWFPSAMEPAVAIRKRGGAALTGSTP